MEKMSLNIAINRQIRYQDTETTLNFETKAKKIEYSDMLNSIINERRESRIFEIKNLKRPRISKLDYTELGKIQNPGSYFRN